MRGVLAGISALFRTKSPRIGTGVRCEPTSEVQIPEAAAGVHLALAPAQIGPWARAPTVELGMPVGRRISELLSGRSSHHSGAPYANCHFSARGYRPDRDWCLGPGGAVPRNQVLPGRPSPRFSARIATRCPEPLAAECRRAQRVDSVVSMAQSEMMARALQEAGKTCSFVKLEGEDHWMSRSEDRVRILEGARIRPPRSSLRASSPRGAPLTVARYAGGEAWWVGGCEALCTK